ncbi:MULTISPECIES: polysaccharide deacetylase [unclassified Bradyrhizobium]|uniref:polysaccharide deacetylase n=1 Tax=unclassified Bradyrhizobium TaxID=2631580 RepID=UPI001FEE1904|nr:MULTISPECIES: polysaccharide deacetylase [unclassified Bradyrhizobium]
MRKLTFAFLLAASLALAPATARSGTDWITGLPRQDIPVVSWPGDKMVAVTFVLYVEVWGRGHGPNFRPDMTGRTPDLVDEGFRQYAINFGLPRTARLFKEMDVPLSLALNAQFPQAQPETWQVLRALVPTAPIIAHGINNSTDLLPLSEGAAAQRVYIRKTLDMIEASTGVRSIGWSSPSVYPDAETFQASAAEGIRYTLDGMDSDMLSRLDTKPAPLVLVPYPPSVVDMGQYLSRFKEAGDLERLWIDYVHELGREAAADPKRPATVVAIGIHPFVVGTPAGAAALRRVLQSLKANHLVWLTDVEAVLRAAGQSR